MDEGLAQLEALDPETVIVVGTVLLDVVSRLERGEDAEDVVFMQFQLLAELRDPQLLRLIPELLQDIEGVGDRLDDVVRLVSTDHGKPPLEGGLVSKQNIVRYIGSAGACQQKDRTELYFTN